MRAHLAKTEQEGGDAEQAEGEREDVEIAVRAITNSIWLKNAITLAAIAALASKQREAAEINRDDRKRAEQRATITPAQRVVAKARIESAMICLACGDAWG